MLKNYALESDSLQWNAPLSFDNVSTSATSCIFRLTSEATQSLNLTLFQGKQQIERALLSLSAQIASYRMNNVQLFFLAPRYMRKARGQRKQTFPSSPSTTSPILTLGGFFIASNLLSLPSSANLRKSIALRGCYIAVHSQDLVSSIS